MSIKVTDLEKSMEIQRDFDFVFGMLDPVDFNRISPILDMSNRHMEWADDIEDPKNGRPPTPEMVKRIVDLFKEKGLDNAEKKVLVHCRAAISRSTAIAIGLLLVRGWSIEMAFNQIHFQRQFMWPNSLILDHFDGLLNLDRKLVDFHNDWKEKQSYKIIRSKEFTENEND